MHWKKKENPFHFTKEMQTLHSSIQNTKRSNFAHNSVQTTKRYSLRK